MDEDIQTVVIDAIANHKCIDPSKITPDSTFADLDISSLDAITIMYDLEEKFDIEVPTDSLETLERVGDIVTGIENLLDGKA